MLQGKKIFSAYGLYFVMFFGRYEQKKEKVCTRDRLYC
ncbi:hypothetical protein BACIH_0830 [Bacillus amyloliquefaciens]|nr:hypothetical protein BACIH_0830 [Bacillus amyloliquefaciens]